MPFNHSSEYAELTDEQFLLIGKIMVEFANIDVLQSMILSKLLLSPFFIGRAYTDSLNASQIQNMLSNALDIHERRYHHNIVSTEITNKIKLLNKKISLLREKRNKFAHYCWTRHTDESVFGLRLLGKHHNNKNPNAGTTIVTLADLKSIYHESYKIVDELNHIHEILPELEENKELVQLLKRNVDK